LLDLALSGLTFYLSADHWEDVIAGSWLGILTAYLSYRLYYPSLSSELAHLPYAPRIHRLDAALSIHDDPEDDPSHYHRQSESESEVELIRGTAKRNDPKSPGQVWEQGPSVEHGRSR
jgi:diacylglycerol diphosphate phosphatase/phosphatidate phosphatase